MVSFCFKLDPLCRPTNSSMPNEHFDSKQKLLYNYIINDELVSRAKHEGNYYVCYKIFQVWTSFNLIIKE